MRVLAALAFATATIVPAWAQDKAMELSIQDVKAKYENELLAKPGVVSVGIARDEQGEPVIVVGLDRERPDLARALPKVLEGHAVRIDIVGGIRAR